LRVNKSRKSSEESVISVLENDFHAALLSIVENQVPLARQSGIAVAYSGGLDSSVLLHLLAKFGAQNNITIHAFHINHGLSINATDWQLFCASTAGQYGVPFQVKQVVVDTQNGEGIEASARSQRYLALGQLATDANVPLLLTAHHQDDQAETLLLQLLRGAGPAGLSGMSDFNLAPDLLGSPHIVIARPLLMQSKVALHSYAQKFGIQFVEDESNTDIKYTRNALRSLVMPALASIAPGYAERLSRSARHAQSALRLLQDLAEIDMQACYFSNALQVEPMRNLSVERIDNLLRYWIAEMNIRMPSVARLAEIRHQIFSARDDAKISVHHEQVIFHRYQGKIFAEMVVSSQSDQPKKFIWQGESAIKFSEFGGTLYFELANNGVEANWLRAQSFLLRRRLGGEKMRLGKNRPSREMKKHFQHLKIPFWMRDQLPYVLVGDNILFAAGVGVNGDFYSENDENLIQLRWQAD
jgi:tRNA(Ile)-lysidine synthase